MKCVWTRNSVTRKVASKTEEPSNISPLFNHKEATTERKLTLAVALSSITAKNDFHSKRKFSANEWFRIHMWRNPKRVTRFRIDSRAASCECVPAGIFFPNKAVQGTDPPPPPRQFITNMWKLYSFMWLVSFSHILYFLWRNVTRSCLRKKRGLKNLKLMYEYTRP